MAEENNYMAEENNDSIVPTFTVEDLPSGTADLEGQAYSEEYAHSLPSPEELKANLAPNKSSRKWKICLAATFFLSIIGIIGIWAAIKNKSGEQVQYNDRLEKVIQFLFDNKISNLPSLRIPNTPARLAAEFIADGDAYNMPLTDETSKRFVERYVLAYMYYAMGGPQWTYKLNFLSAKDHCDWFTRFETTSGGILREGVLCDNEGRVDKLMLGKWKETTKSFIKSQTPSAF
jgi:hypothetical protein